MTASGINSAALLADLKKQLKLLVADLTERAEATDDPENSWAPRLREQFDEATRRERTGLAWIDWRDGQVDQAAVAWIVATTFLRFCEDNHLLEGARLNNEAVATRWLAGPDGATARAVENQSHYLRANPTHNRRDWLLHAFEVLRAQPAARSLLSDHNPVWSAWPSAEGATRLVDFWRATDDDGALLHDFTDPALGTRFLGDLYQDLSEHAKKTYALLQTPVFVEEFILDRTLTPALEEFGLTGTDGGGFKLIDPTCGSGHFLLGAFERLHERWLVEAPELGQRERVRRAMDAIHGVDLNPFAVAIARFRLTVAGLKEAGETTLVGAAPLGFHLAVGDSLLGAQGHQDELTYDDAEPFSYDVEDLAEYGEILRVGQYHVVVGNPPYITVKDKALNQAYREAYPTCKGTYALSVPFMELFFRLALAGSAGRPAGFVGQITANSFMKRGFGKRLIEELLAGQDHRNYVDLLDVIDTSGAYIPGHGTPTVILVGRRRRPHAEAVRAVLGVRGEPGQPMDPAQGHVWSEITEHVDNGNFEGVYVTVTELDRTVLSTHPWSLSGGTSGVVKAAIESAPRRLQDSIDPGIGRAVRIGSDDAFLRPLASIRREVAADRLVPFIEGEDVRDLCVRRRLLSLYPYVEGEAAPGLLPEVLWLLRPVLAARSTFQGVMADAGREWWEYMQHTASAYQTPLSLVFSNVATHNHFALDRGGSIFSAHAPVIKLPEGASEQDHLDLLGVLNSSTACFWLKQVSQMRGGDADQPWARTYEFTGTKLQEFPLPARLPGVRGARIDALAQRLSSLVPDVVLSKSGSEIRSAVERAREDWYSVRALMIAEQEELDWEVYRLYGLVEEDLNYQGQLPLIAPAERAFAIDFAQRLNEGLEDSTWFTERTHQFTPVLELPQHWPADYRDLVQRRLDVIAMDPQIAILERPENKRRWSARRDTDPGYEPLLQAALRDAILDRLEDPALWRDSRGPVLQSVAQLAVALRSDEVLAELASLYTGQAEPDLLAVLTSLAPDEAVPYLAAHRYKEPGLAKYRAWQHTWDLQRREDAGEQVDVPVPPKYGQADFRKLTYWKARGKLDVPKERFLAYPEVTRTGDTSLALGWAGWDHADQARALLREIVPLLGDPDSADRLPSLLAGLVELEPWLQQWHAEPEPGGQPSPAEQVTGALTGLLGQLGLTREDVTAWLPPAPTRGRRKASS